MTQQRIESLDALRGFAALSVVWFHLTRPYDNFAPVPFLAKTGDYGNLGVQVFFVISGFIIPYALSRSDYRIKYYGRFLLKRIVRLDPPYFVTIAVIILLTFLSALISRTDDSYFPFSFVQLILHLGYLNVFFEYRWLSGVFWTLAVEFQYYLIMGLLFPVISSNKALMRYTAFVALGLLAFTSKSGAFLFHYLFLFMLGIWTFQMYVGIVGRRLYLPGLLVLGLGTFFTLGFPAALVGVAAALIIVYVKINTRLLSLLGAISYSLYLIHLPIKKFVFLSGAELTDHQWMHLLCVVVSLAISMLAAYLLYRYVERPSQEWSARISYNTNESGVQMIDRESL